MPRRLIGKIELTICMFYKFVYFLKDLQETGHLFMFLVNLGEIMTLRILR